MVWKLSCGLGSSAEVRNSAKTPGQHGKLVAACEHQNLICFLLYPFVLQQHEHHPTLVVNDPNFLLRGTDPKHEKKIKFPLIRAMLSSCLPGPLQRASGYEGTEDMYFSSSVLNAAYEAEGLALDFWTGCWANSPVAPAFSMSFLHCVGVRGFVHCFGILRFDLSRSCPSRL